MLAFIDESGCIHPNDPNPVSVLLAVCMEEKHHRDASRSLYGVQKGILETEDFPELKATRLINQRTFRRHRKKWQLVEGLFGLIRDLEIVVFAIVVPRPERPLSLPDGHLPTPHRFLLQRVNALAEELDHYAILVYDGQGRNIQGIEMSSCISKYVFRVAEYNKILSRIVDTPLFVDSGITPGVQIADACASVVRQYEEKRIGQFIKPGDLYAFAISRFYRCVRAKTRDDLTDDYGKKLYGIYKMRRESLDREETEDANLEIDAGEEAIEKGGPAEAEPPLKQ